MIDDSDGDFVLLSSTGKSSTGKSSTGKSIAWLIGALVFAGTLYAIAVDNRTECERWRCVGEPAEVR